MTAPDGCIVDGEHVLPLRVYYEDTDAGSIVYYANYLKFAERGRTEMLRALGVDHQALARDHGLTFVVRGCSLDCLRPARLDDMIEVRSRLLELGGASLEAEQLVLRDGVELARLRVRLACMDQGGRAARMPPALRAALAVCRAPAQTRNADTPKLRATPN